MQDLQVKSSPPVMNRTNIHEDPAIIQVGQLHKHISHSDGPLRYIKNDQYDYHLASIWLVSHAEMQ